MKKIVLFLVMVITMVRTIPSISVNTKSAINTITTIEEDTKIIKSPKPLSVSTILPDESTGNTTNQGLAIHDKDKIYYSDGTDLYSASKDGRLKTKLADQAYPINIQVIGDEIYYINQETHNIYRSHKDGRPEEKISDDKVYSLNIYNRRLYFMDRYNNLYMTSMSLDGKDKKVIKEIVVNDMMVYKDYIYYITKEGELGEVRIDGLNHRILNRGIIQFDISRQGIYYTYDPRIAEKPQGLYHLDFGDNKESQLLSETPYSFNIHGSAIYYNHPSNLSLYAMALDGTGKRQITGVNTSQINIAGDFIFYRNLEDNKKIYRINLDGTNRMSLEGKILVSNVTDLTKEIDDLGGKEISPKLKRSYNVAKDIIAKIIAPEMGDYERAKKVHDYVVNHASYDVEAAENFLKGQPSDANAFMAYGILINQKGVCQGYAEAVQILLSLAGLESDLVIGEASTGDGNYISHMWNIVAIDDEYYMLDATWDDPVGPRDIILHDYFLVDSEALKKTHIWAYDEHPPCNAKRR